MDLQILTVILLAYVLGSIPFGLIIARIFNLDIRKHGSGNIGATNVFRTLGPVAGVIVFTLDLLKGTLPVYLAVQITADPWLIILAGLAAVLGHTYSIFMKFKGGRGVATGLGILLGIAPEIFVGALIMGLLIILISRYVSLASICMPPLVTLALILLNKPLPYTIIAGLITVLIIVRHIPNIKRLVNGTERKIGQQS